MNRAPIRRLYEEEIFNRYGPSRVNISPKPGGYLDDVTHEVFLRFVEEQVDLIKKFFDKEEKKGDLLSHEAPY